MEGRRGSAGPGAGLCGLGDLLVEDPQPGGAAHAMYWQPRCISGTQGSTTARSSSDSSTSSSTSSSESAVDLADVGGSEAGGPSSSPAASAWLQGEVGAAAGPHGAAVREGGAPREEELPARVGRVPPVVPGAGGDPRYGRAGEHHDASVPRCAVLRGLQPRPRRQAVRRPQVLPPEGRDRRPREDGGDARRHEGVPPPGPRADAGSASQAA
eukprot:6950787-Pyramimonas_sp.AAC.1